VTEIVFFYRARHAKERIPVAAGELVALIENVEYVFEFPTPPHKAELGELAEMGYDAISDTMGTLKFSNFVGETTLAGARLKVISSKLGDLGVAELLTQVSQLSSNLVFGWRAPSGFAVTGSGEQQAPLPFHQLQFLRDVILRRQPGSRLLDFFNAAARSPTRRFLMERPVVQTARVRNLNAHSIQDIFRHPERLMALTGEAAVESSPLTEALKMGSPPLEHFPTSISVSARRLTYDTPENRFLKHFLAECLSIVYRFLGDQKLHSIMRADCRAMVTALETANCALFLQEVGTLTSFSGPTQALAKAEGYKEMLELWIALNEHQSLPSSEELVQRLLQGKDVALLYEYWVFLKVLETISTALGHQAPPLGISRTDLGESLERGLRVQLTKDITVSFNPSFNRSACSAYSTPLRPDVVLTLIGARYAFDAKYRLQRLSRLEDAEEEEEEITVVRTDIYKMHTYRDAITNMRAAFVVYPGTEFLFFERGMQRRRTPEDIVEFDGVGAIPARPENHKQSALLDVIKTLLKNQRLLT